jgi:hypothetical protein
VRVRGVPAGINLDEGVTVSANFNPKVDEVNVGLVCTFSQRRDGRPCGNVSLALRALHSQYICSPVKCKSRRLSSLSWRLHELVSVAKSWFRKASRCVGVLVVVDLDVVVERGMEERGALWVLVPSALPFHVISPQSLGGIELPPSIELVAKVACATIVKAAFRYTFAMAGHSFSLSDCESWTMQSDSTQT